MDLSKIDIAATSEKGVAMEMRNPVTMDVVRNEDGAACTITLCGMDSQRYRKATDGNIDRRLQSQQPGRRINVSAAAIRNDEVEVAVACTLAWSGIELNGQPLEFSAVNARKLYTQFPWLFEQVWAFIGDRSNFAQASAT